MKRNLGLALIPALLLCGAGVTTAQEIKPIVVLQDSAPTMYGRSAKVKARIEAVDLASRELTFKGPKGRSVTMRVVERAKNLSDIKAGDEVIVRYNESVAVELRKAEAGESVGAVEEVAPEQSPEQSPADGSKRTTLVTSVEAVSSREKLVTVVGPTGNLIDLYVRDPEVLSAVAAGDTVVTTYTEAVAVSIEIPKDKQKPKPRKRR